MGLAPGCCSLPDPSRDGFASVSGEYTIYWVKSCATNHHHHFRRSRSSAILDVVVVVVGSGSSIVVGGVVRALVDGIVVSYLASLGDADSVHAPNVQ